MRACSVYLGLGSNVGDRAANLNLALYQLGQHIVIVTVSSVYETEPVGYAEQPPFLNAVCLATTSLSPRQLLHLTQTTETMLGRQPTFRNGPRPIDIDILLYGELQLHADDLVIPHRALPDRLFVLAPLAEIAPDLMHPTIGQTIRQLAESCPDRHWVRRLNGGQDVPAIH